MKKHSTNKPFPCPVCPKAFTEKGNLGKHLRMKHPEYSLTHGNDLQKPQELCKTETGKPIVDSLPHLLKKPATIQLQMEN